MTETEELKKNGAWKAKGPYEKIRKAKSRERGGQGTENQISWLGTYWGFMFKGAKFRTALIENWGKRS